MFTLTPQVVFGAPAQGLRRQGLDPRGELSVPDDVTGYAKCVSSFMDATQRPMDLRMPRVVVVDCQPRLGAKLTWPQSRLARHVRRLRARFNAIALPMRCSGMAHLVARNRA
jgi:hypothetical protein